MARLLVLLSFFLALADPVFAAFGYTSSGGNYIVDAGSPNPLVFSVSQSSCDINSIKYRGIELQSTEKNSHIGSGLGSARVSVQQGAGAARWIKVTCETDTLTHYLVVREGDSTIFMATYITAEPSVGELRFLARLRSDVLPYEYPFGVVSTTGGASSTVEGSDVFVVNGQTRSKFYSSERFIDKDAHCVWGESPEMIHACMLVPQYESSSGGPFFRDIETNNVGSKTTNIFNYMNSGHVQTEKFRTGLHGPYYLQFSRSGIPKLREADVSWMSKLGMKGYVASADRGSVSGRASGIDSSQHSIVVHWFNDAAQYWTYAAANGQFTSPAMKPGTYTQVLYQTEFEVARTSVSVSRGNTATKDIASSLPSRNYIWQIGKLDGQPVGFRNADKFLRMHPSDARMAAWGPLTYTVGSSSDNDMAMAIFKDVNNPQTIKFNLASAPSGTSTLRIATTLSFAGARPQATVNGWAGAIPSAPTKIDSRGVTRGAYRGLGEVYDLTIPAGTLKSGANTITISAVSGSGGSGFLSPNFILDAVQLFSN
ncbi:polysaccharide lyase family 4 protein [Emericellopsis atlantica]|uniref:Rhamnogalacturonate lyase n=1 Tax=Emericellopsis atlantica TaxID=2614577 RepID=A0A9P7ZKC1_9HYPO|nr:polysaccharide lyase family 4 protein [Emericellopsis atlantica]KAG9253718.1 polysaccharide lyase family 4 protein [Emericellopsis atlantica]